MLVLVLVDMMRILTDGWVLEVRMRLLIENVGLFDEEKIVKL